MHELELPSPGTVTILCILGALSVLSTISCVIVGQFVPNDQMSSQISLTAFFISSIISILLTLITFFIVTFCSQVKVFVESIYDK